MIRRLKGDVLKELPPKRRQIIELPADTPELKAALAGESEVTAAQAEAAVVRAALETAQTAGDTDAFNAAVAKLKFSKQLEFTAMSRVRRETATAKAPLVAAHVRDAVEASGKVIVMAHRVAVIDHLKTALADLGVVVVTGDVPPAKRQEAVDAFQSDPAIKVFLGNILAAGVGLTLTASSHVVFAELDWVPGNVSQAEDRAHRIGQKQSVLVQHLVLEGSLDALMAATILEKQEVIDAALDGIESTDDRAARIAAIQATFEVGEAALVEAPVETDVEFPAWLTEGENVPVHTGESLPEEVIVTTVTEIPESETFESPEPVAAPVAVEVAEAEADETPKRPRGRPKKEGGPKSRAEITREWRSRSDATKIQVSGPLAGRIRALRTARGQTIEALLSTALDALEAPPPSPKAPPPRRPPTEPQPGSVEHLVQIASETAHCPIGHRVEDIAPGKTVVWLWPVWPEFLGTDHIGPEGRARAILRRDDGRAEIWCSSRYDGVGSRAIAKRDTPELAAIDIGRDFQAEIQVAAEDKANWEDPRHVDFRARAQAEMDRLGIKGESHIHSYSVNLSSPGYKFGCGLHLHRGEETVRIKLVSNGQTLATATSVEAAIQAGWAYTLAGRNKAKQAEALAPLGQ